MSFVPAREHAQSTCQGWLTYQLIYVAVLTLAVEYVLIVRGEWSICTREPLFSKGRITALVLYRENTAARYALIAAYLTELVILVCGLVLARQRMTMNSSCLITSSSGLFLLFW